MVKNIGTVDEDDMDEVYITNDEDVIQAVQEDEVWSDPDSNRPEDREPIDGSEAEEEVEDAEEESPEEAEELQDEIEESVENAAEKILEEAREAFNDGEDNE